MLAGSQKPAAATPPSDDIAAGPAHRYQTAKDGTIKHSQEAPYIKDADFELAQFNTVEGSAPFLPDNRKLPVKLLCNHVLVYGGSGSGKTYTWGNQYIREIFRCHHLPRGAKRDWLKPGMMFIEAKSDYTPKAHRLACRYGRVSDCYWLGPAHENSIDPFGDDTENPMMKAQKMAILLAAYNGGSKGSDPFWMNSAVLLYSALFNLHATLRQHHPDDTPPMDFELMYVLLQGSSANKNQRELNTYNNQLARIEGDFKQYGMSLLEILATLEQALADAGMQCETAQAPLSALLENSEHPSEPTVEEDNLAGLVEQEDAEARIEESYRLCQELINELDRPQYPDALFNQLANVRSAFEAYLGGNAEWGTQKITTDGLGAACRLSVALAGFSGNFMQLYLNLRALDRNDKPLLNSLYEVFNQLKAAAQTYNRCVSNLNLARTQWQNAALDPVKPVPFLIKEMVEKYREIIVRQIAEAKNSGAPIKEHNSVLEYFDGTFFNPEKEKTIGGITMSAAVVAGFLSQPPFNKMFNAKPSFAVMDIVTKGAIVGLHMTFAAERDAAVLAAVLLKLEFFRAAQLKEYLNIDSDRRVLYFVDELATTITTGEFTGEAGFLDKVRGYGGMCNLITQSVPQLLNRAPQSEVDSLNTNTQIKVYLRNDDKTTKHMAAEASGTVKRAVGTPTRMSDNLLSANADPGKGATYHFEEKTAMRAEDFDALGTGECLVILPSEVEKHDRRRRIVLKGDPLDEICPQCGDLTFARAKDFKDDEKIVYWKCAACGHKAGTHEPEIPLTWRNEFIVAERRRQRERAQSPVPVKQLRQAATEK